MPHPPSARPRRARPLRRIACGMLTILFAGLTTLACDDDIEGESGDGRGCDGSTAASGVAVTFLGACEDDAIAVSACNGASTPAFTAELCRFRLDNDSSTAVSFSALSNQRSPIVRNDAAIDIPTGASREYAVTVRCSTPASEAGRYIVTVTRAAGGSVCEETTDYTATVIP